MWVGAEVVSFVHPISWVVLDLWPLLLVGKGLSVLLAHSGASTCSLSSRCLWGGSSSLQLSSWFV